MNLLSLTMTTENMQILLTFLNDSWNISVSLPKLQFAKILFVHFRVIFSIYNFTILRSTALDEDFPLVLHSHPPETWALMNFFNVVFTGKRIREANNVISWNTLNVTISKLIIDAIKRKFAKLLSLFMSEFTSQIEHFKSISDFAQRIFYLTSWFLIPIQFKESINFTKN